MMPEPAPLCQVTDVSLIRGNRLLFKQLSFCLQAGTVLHISGKNGSGKTSLFKLLMGMLPPTQGHIRLMGKPPAQQITDNPYSIGYLGHQNPVKTQLTVFENIKINANLCDGYSASQDAIISAIEAVGLSAFSDTLVGKLSAGQKRRVLLARLWLLPDKWTTEKRDTTRDTTRDTSGAYRLWLLDEPLTALDSTGSEQIMQRVVQLAKLGHSFIITSHQPLPTAYAVQALNLEDAG